MEHGFASFGTPLVSSWPISAHELDVGPAGPGWDCCVGSAWGALGSRSVPVLVHVAGASSSKAAAIRR
jgi:hypothetical protein